MKHTTLRRRTSATRARGTLRRVSAVLTVSVWSVACVGGIGARDDSSRSGEQPPPSRPGRSEAPGTAGTGGAAGTAGAPAAPGANGGSNGPEAPLPFEPSSAWVATAKVKNLLVGLPPTAEEVAAVKKDAAALKDLIDAWLELPQAKAKLLVFFANAFQQTAFAEADLADQLGGMPFRTGSGLRQFMQSMRESIPRTAWELMTTRQPWNRIVTTHSFMMNPLLMSVTALADSRTKTDKGDATVDALAPKDWRFRVVPGPLIPLEETLDPTHPNYMVWGDPTLSPCATSSTGARTYDSTLYLFAKFTGVILKLGMCQNVFKTAFKSDDPTNFTPEDVANWKMVTVRAPRPGEEPTKFWDLPKLRKTAELVVNTPRVGFFTTPAFFSTWRTNGDNDARVHANQTIIVALGASFDPASSIVPLSNAGLDPEHATPGTVCYACHKSLDPMREFFRKTYTLFGDPQLDPAQRARTASFAFDGVAKGGNTIDDFAQIIADHPSFPAAWAQKLCYYANSAPCSARDPEFERVVAAFRSSKLDFKTLLRELLASPLVTNLRRTQTTEERGEVVSIARYDHYCALLGNRLGLADPCNLTANVTTLSQAIPADGFSRGADTPVLTDSPSLFVRSATENICLALGDRVVDVPGARYNSTNVDGAFDDLVRNVMGLPDGDPRAAGARQILVEHYNAARVGNSAAGALKSTFVLACTAPATVSVGL